MFPTRETTNSTFSDLKLKWINVNLKGVDQANFNMPMCIGHTQLLGVFLVYISVIFFLCLFFLFYISVVTPENSLGRVHWH